MNGDGLLGVLAAINSWAALLFAVFAAAVVSPPATRRWLTQVAVFLRLRPPPMNSGSASANVRWTGRGYGHARVELSPGATDEQRLQWLETRVLELDDATFRLSMRDDELAQSIVTGDDKVRGEIAQVRRDIQEDSRRSLEVDARAIPVAMTATALAAIGQLPAWAAWGGLVAIGLGSWATVHAWRRA